MNREQLVRLTARAELPMRAVSEVHRAQELRALAQYSPVAAPLDEMALDAEENARILFELADEIHPPVEEER